MRVIEYLFPALRRRREAREAEVQQRWADYERQCEKNRIRWAEMEKEEEERAEEDRKQHQFKQKIKALRTRAEFHRASARVKP